MAATPTPDRTTSSAWRWVVLIGLGVVPPGVLVALRSSLEESTRIWFEARLLYFTMPIVLALALAAGLWRWRAGQGIRAAAARLWLGCVAAVALTAIVLVLVPPRIRMQFDETSLVGVSQNMHLQRAALLTTGAVPFEGGIVPLENMIDKRPPLFAFLTSILHDLGGYRIANAFAVNAGLLATALLLVFAKARSRLGLPASLAAPFLLLAVPLTSIVATSAAFELLAAVLFTVVLLAALDFVARPDTVRWVAFLASGVLFAQSRYESLPALVLVGVVVLCSVWRRWRPDWRARVALAACPGLVTPLVFLLLHSQNPSFYPEARGRDLMSLQHGLEHVVPFLAAWSWPLLDNALPGCLSIAAVIAYGLWVWRRRASIGDVVVGVPVAGVTLVVLCWFYGDVREPTALRLFLPIAWLTALVPLLLPALFGGRVGAGLLCVSVGLCGVQLHAVHRGERFPQQDAARLTEAIDVLMQELPSDPATLWVGTPAQHLVVKGHAALTAQWCLSRARDLEDLVRRGHVKRIYVLETPLDKADGSVRALLAGASADVVSRSGGEMPITVHRLRL